MRILIRFMICEKGLRILRNQFMTVVTTISGLPMFRSEFSKSLVTLKEWLKMLLLAIPLIGYLLVQIMALLNHTPSSPIGIHLVD